MRQWLFVLAGHLFVCVAIIGIPTPGLPSTPFAILALSCYARGSSKLHARLRGSKFFGKAIRDFEDSGAVSRWTKLVAVTMVTLSIGIATLAVPSWPLKAVLFVTGLLVSSYILTRPTREQLPPD